MKVKTDYVPEDCDYLTAGKVYTLVSVSPDEDCGLIIDDTGDTLFIVFSESEYINGKPWTVIDEEDKTMARQTTKAPTELLVSIQGHLASYYDVLTAKRDALNEAMEEGYRLNKDEQETYRELNELIAAVNNDVNALGTKIGAANEPS